MRLSQIIRNGFVCFEMSTRDEPPEDRGDHGFGSGWGQVGRR